MRLLTEKIIYISDESMTDRVHRYGWCLNRDEAEARVARKSFIAIYIPDTMLPSISGFVYFNHIGDTRWRAKMTCIIHSTLSHRISALVIENMKKEFYRSANELLDQFILDHPSHKY